MNICRNRKKRKLYRCESDIQRNRKLNELVILPIFSPHSYFFLPSSFPFPSLLGFSSFLNSSLPCRHFCFLLPCYKETRSESKRGKRKNYKEQKRLHFERVKKWGDHDLGSSFFLTQVNNFHWIFSPRISERVGTKNEVRSKVKMHTTDYNDEICNEKITCLRAESMEEFEWNFISIEFCGEDAQKERVNCFRTENNEVNDLFVQLIQFEMGKRG